jgi:hypothetical protein
LASVPTIVAVTLLPLAKVTRTLLPFASATTWLLVRMYPLVSSTTPEPSPFCVKMDTTLSLTPATMPASEERSSAVEEPRDAADVPELVAPLLPESVACTMTPPITPPPPARSRARSAVASSRPNCGDLPPDAGTAVVTGGTPGGAYPGPPP